MFLLAKTVSRRRLPVLLAPIRRVYPAQTKLFSIVTPEEDPLKPEFVSNAANESGVVAQYRVVPVTEHPIFPGSSAALSLTKDQYEVSLFMINTC